MQLIITETIIVFFLLLIMTASKSDAIEIDNLTGREYEYSNFLLFCFAIAIIIPAAFRYGYSDTVNYKGLYISGGSNYANAFNGSLPFEPGYSLFQIFLYNISPNPQFIIFVTSIIIIVLDIKFINRYSTSLPFSLFLYFVLTYTTALNGIRQSLAAVLLITAMPLVLKKKTLQYILLILLASLFHKSVLIMIPLYFIISGDRLNKGVYIFLSFSIFSVFVPKPLYSVLTFLMEDSDYLSYLNVTDRMNSLRLIAHIVPTIVVYLFAISSYNFNDQNNRLITVLSNMQVLSLAFYILSIKMVFFARAGAYLRGTTAVILPTAIDGFFSSRNNRLVKSIAIALYVIFWIFEIAAGVSYHQWEVFKLNWSLF